MENSNTHIADADYFDTVGGKQTTSLRTVLVSGVSVSVSVVFVSVVVSVVVVVGGSFLLQFRLGLLGSRAKRGRKGLGRE